MSKFLDSNTLRPAIAFKRLAIASDTDNDGEVIDTQGVRDINFLTTIDTLVAGDLKLQIRTADNAGMSTNVEVIAASKINGNLYDSVILFAALLVDQMFHHHIQRTAHRRFVQLRLVSSNSADYAIHATLAQGLLGKTDSKGKNPIAP